MLDVFLYRFFENDEVTFGYISLDGKITCYTMELPWLANQKNISCIPTGSYKTLPIVHPKKKNIWRILDVPGRLGIQIHAGNYPFQIEGCILPGLSFASGVNALYSSRLALNSLIKQIGFVQFKLHIKNKYAL